MDIFDYPFNSENASGADKPAVADAERKDPPPPKTDVIVDKDTGLLLGTVAI